MSGQGDPPDLLEDDVAPAAAIERVLIENQRRFIGFVEARIGSRAIAEELVQSALVRALETDAGRIDEEGIVNWFYRVLQNALVDHHRRSGAERRALEREGSLAEEPAEDPELRTTVCACMHDLLPTLKPEYADLVRKVDLEEQPVSAAAQAIGITANNASVRLHRGRQALKRQLERSCGACAAHGCLDCSCATRNGDRLLFRPEK